MRRTPDGYHQYSRFCDRYREWRGRLDVVLCQVYRAGEKAFVDYAGPKVEVTDRRTGEVHEAKLFVAVLAASNHRFVDVTLTPVASGLDGVARADVRALGRRPGAPHPGQREGGGAAGEPVRAVRQPAVQNVGRCVLAPLPNHRFFSPSEAREAIAPLLAALNERRFQKIEGSRRSLFEDLDRPALKSLPAERYEYAE